MRILKQLFDKNAEWASSMVEEDPKFFENLSKQQKPEILWIGCADSRVPANQVIGMQPGSVFVHRNVANVVPHTDLNVLSVMQYAVEVLQVKHVIVCGHYGCGGVQAAMAGRQHGLIDNWLRHIKDVYYWNREEIDGIQDDAARIDRMCELNVKAQVANVVSTTIVQNAWKRGQSLDVHGWIYGLHDGRLKDLGLCISNSEQVETIFRME